MVERAHADHLDRPVALGGEGERLGRDLAPHVRGHRLERSGPAYRDRRRVDASVLLRAPHDHDATDARGRAAVEHVGGTADVDPLHGLFVVPRRAHVAPGREVEDDVGGDGGDPAPHRVGVGDVDRVASTAIEHDGVVTARL